MDKILISIIRNWMAKNSQIGKYVQWVSAIIAVIIYYFGMVQFGNN